MIWSIIPGWLKRAVAWLAAALGAVGLAWLAGNRNARQQTALEAAEAYAKTTERMHDADLGIGASDQQRIDRLREFADGE